MENPATWGAAERAVHEVLVNGEFMIQRTGYRAGLSLTRQITDALRAAGLLSPLEEN